MDLYNPYRYLYVGLLVYTLTNETHIFPRIIKSFTIQCLEKLENGEKITWLDLGSLVPAVGGQDIFSFLLYKDL